MAYLAEMKLVHRDLATRNVLIATDEKICKISDFGLARDVYVNDTYWKKGSGKCKIDYIGILTMTPDFDWQCPSNGWPPSH